jgi:hypothetical protein
MIGMTRTLSIALWLAALVVIGGCLVDKGELTEEFPPGFCDSIAPTYADSLKTLIDVYCASSVGCHGAQSSNGDFTTYANMQAAGVLGGMPSRIEARVIDGNPSFMPLNAPLADSVKAVFQCWIDAGFPQE